MNVLEKYAANCGVKINDPFVGTSYFPLIDKPYIVFDNRNKYGTNIYDLFHDVMTYIKPALDREGIEAISFEKNEKDILEGAKPYLGLFKKQENYLIKNSKLVVACDNLSNYVASGLKVPSVGLYSVYPKVCTQPMWSDSYIAIESHRDGNLPAYGVPETPKTVNFIEPEKVADAIFKLLGLPDKVPHTTFYIGDLYPTKVVEVIPDFAPPAGFMENRALNLRMDYHFSEKNAISWITNRKINLLTDRPINLNLLKYFNKSIAQLTININDDFTEDYLMEAKATGINVELFCEDASRIQDYRFNLFDFSINESIFNKKEDLGEDIKNLNDKTKFVTGKVLLSEGKKYSCYEAKKIKKELTTEPELIYDTEDFWKELDHYRLINEL